MVGSTKSKKSDLYVFDGSRTISRDVTWVGRVVSRVGEGSSGWSSLVLDEIDPGEDPQGLSVRGGRRSGGRDWVGVLDPSDVSSLLVESVLEDRGFFKGLQGRVGGGRGPCRVSPRPVSGWYSVRGPGPVGTPSVRCGSETKVDLQTEPGTTGTSDIARTKRSFFSSKKLRDEQKEAHVYDTLVVFDI